MKGEILALIAALLWGIVPILDKYALQEVPTYPAIVIRAFGGFAAILTISAILKDFNFNFSKAAVLLLISGAISGAFGMIFYFEALKSIGASRAVPITAIYPMFTAVFSLIFLSELISARVLIGIVLIIVGIILVSEV
ncbi:MAG: DMT family transporter [Archaeoglobaceae archaeon]|nr:DMT family transporter [Archaeoglobaceae archaeon]MDW7989465.1 DMT family transporter [Archaeoglobaceae archaeon]